MRVAEPAIVKENQICDGKIDIIGCHPNRDLSFDWSKPTLIPELIFAMTKLVAWVTRCGDGQLKHGRTWVPMV